MWDISSLILEIDSEDIQWTDSSNMSGVFLMMLPEYVKRTCQGDLEVVKKRSRRQFVRSQVALIYSCTILSIPMRIVLR